MKAKRCPFCKGHPTMMIFDIGVVKLSYAVACKECGCRTGRFYTEEEALEKWNRRDDYDYVYEKGIE